MVEVEELAMAPQRAVYRPMGHGSLRLDSMSYKVNKLVSLGLPHAASLKWLDDGGGWSERERQRQRDRETERERENTLGTT